VFFCWFYCDGSNVLFDNGKLLLAANDCRSELFHRFVVLCKVKYPAVFVAIKLLLLPADSFTVTISDLFKSMHVRSELAEVRVTSPIRFGSIESSAVSVFFVRVVRVTVRVGT
jgi:hypothetical protein